MLFDNEERELAWALRGSVVAPAVRSPGAKKKAGRKKNGEGLPVHSFGSLLCRPFHNSQESRVLRVPRPGADEGSGVRPSDYPHPPPAKGIRAFGRSPDPVARNRESQSGSRIPSSSGNPAVIVLSYGGNFGLVLIKAGNRQGQ